MTEFVAVITAKATSTRLPNKNCLPLGGRPLTAWSIEAARRAGLRTLVATDHEQIAAAARAAGCEVYGHACGLTHAEVIRETLAAAGAENAACVLLQPSSPFRAGNIVRRCIRRYRETAATVVTTNVVHDVRLDGDTVRQTPDHLTMWDGCVVVFPPGGVCRWSPAVGVRNLPGNSLQIDTEDDYELACAAAEAYRDPHPIVPPQVAYVLEEPLRASGAIGGRVAVVGRLGEIPPGHHVWHVNHCLGYAGGRCDGVAIVANRHLRETGIGPATLECVAKARAVLVRDNGELAWLREQLPEMAGKFLRMGAFTQADDRVTTGTILVDLLTTLGCDVTLVGAFRPGNVLSALIPFHWPAASREVATLHLSAALTPLPP